MKHTTIAVDLAKHVFELAVSDRPGRVRERHRIPRAQFRRFFVQREAATVLLEACGSAHYWGRELQSLGHQVVLLPPHAVRPYVVRNKTDRSDAKALLEAARNTDLHSVPIKSIPQQTLTALHRLRSMWLAARTARLNTLRGLLHEFGVVIPATALVAFVGDIQRFPSGDRYLRTLLTHGARAVLWHSKRLEHPDRLRAWALRLESLRGHNKAAIGLANKLARIVWAVRKTDAPFRELTTAAHLED